MNDSKGRPHYSVDITDTLVDVTRTYRSTEMGWDEENSWLWWTTGNASCDCNRGTWFDEAAGINGYSRCDDEVMNGAGPYPCGESRYTVSLAVLDDGREIDISARF